MKVYPILTSALALWAPLNVQADESGENSEAQHGTLLAFDEAIAQLQAGIEDVDVAVEGVILSQIDEDDYRFEIGGTEVLLELWDETIVLAIGDTIAVTGELEYSDDSGSAFMYELEAYSLSGPDGERIAVKGDDDEGVRDDDDDDDDDYAERMQLTFADAVARLDAGWDEAYVVADGVATAWVEDDAYRFVIGDIAVLLEADDLATLPLDETLRVTGELELADSDDQSLGFVYELDAIRIEDAAGVVLYGGERSEDDDDDTDRDEKGAEQKYGRAVEGTLAELVELIGLEDDDIKVRVVGTLGELVGAFEDDDADYYFSDASGTTVVLDLDSRADLHFALAVGMEIEVMGELERIDDGAPVNDGVAYELDAVWIRLADGTALDVGQLTNIAGSTISDWIGYFWKLEDEGWYYHPSKGLVYSDHSLGEDDWFFSLSREDWVFADKALYPYVYAGEGGWHFLIGSSFGGVQHAYSYDDDEWILYFWEAAR